jgi:radical SAM superfamily enzyme YgiQ (UPF0313 family)
MKIALNVFFSKRSPTIPIISSRGCPFHCSFCASYLTEGRTFRSRSPEHVLDEIEFLAKEYGVNEIQFWDSNCIYDNDRMIKICKGILDRKLDIAWSCPNGIRITSIQPEVAEWMGKSGCHLVFLGIESGSERIQKQIKKALPLKIIPEKIALLRKNGINIGGFFMFGFPGETREDINKTINLIDSLDIDTAQLSIFVPLPGSEIFHELRTSRTFQYTDAHFDKTINTFTEIEPHDLLNLVSKTLYRFMLNPKRIIFLLRNLNTWQKWIYLFRSFVNRSSHIVSLKLNNMKTSKK